MSDATSSDDADPSESIVVRDNDLMSIGIGLCAMSSSSKNNKCRSCVGDRSRSGDSLEEVIPATEFDGVNGSESFRIRWALDPDRRDLSR